MGEWFKTWFWKNYIQKWVIYHSKVVQYLKVNFIKETNQEEEK